MRSTKSSSRRSTARTSRRTGTGRVLRADRRRPCGTSTSPRASSTTSRPARAGHRRSGSTGSAKAGPRADRELPDLTAADTLDDLCDPAGSSARPGRKASSSLSGTEWPLRPRPTGRRATPRGRASSMRSRTWSRTGGSGATSTGRFRGAAALGSRRRRPQSIGSGVRLGIGAPRRARSADRLEQARGRVGGVLRTTRRSRPDRVPRAARLPGECRHCVGFADGDRPRRAASPFRGSRARSPGDPGERSIDLQADKEAFAEHWGFRAGVREEGGRAAGTTLRVRLELWFGRDEDGEIVGVSTTARRASRTGAGFRNARCPGPWRRQRLGEALLKPRSASSGAAERRGCRARCRRARARRGPPAVRARRHARSWRRDHLREAAEGRARLRRRPRADAPVAELLNEISRELYGEAELTRKECRLSFECSTSFGRRGRRCAGRLRRRPAERRRAPWRRRACARARGDGALLLADRGPCRTGLIRHSACGGDERRPEGMREVLVAPASARSGTRSR